METYGTGRVDDQTLQDLIRSNFALTPDTIIETLKLRRPLFRKTAAYGHFGREEEGFTWEVTDKAAILRRQAGLAISDQVAD